MLLKTLLCNLFFIDLSETGNFFEDWSLFFEMPRFFKGYDKGWLISGWLTFQSVNVQQVLDIDKDVWMSYAVGQYFVWHSWCALSVSVVLVAHQLTVWWDVSEDCLAATGSKQSVNSSSVYCTRSFSFGMSIWNIKLLKGTSDFIRSCSYTCGFVECS